MDSFLMHYGTPRRSGRYPWGSGGDPYQRNKSLLGHIKSLREQGLSEVEIAKGLGINTSQLRAMNSIAKAEVRAADASQALRLKDKGVSNSEIGRIMGINESSVRALLDPALKERAAITNTTADMLKRQVEDKIYLDVGAGIEQQLGVSRSKLKTSLALLEEQGYKTSYVKVPQLGTGKMTTVMVLTKEDVPYSDIFKNRDNIRMPNDYSEDSGRSYLGIEPIRNIDGKRIMVRYNEEGGADKDGVIELRRGIDDISLGESLYAQVRIGVNGSHYLKGMAVYTDDIPDGVDIIFNTNKRPTGNQLDAMKAIKDDPDNPFGSTVRQRHYIDADGNSQLSALNIVNEEGDWGNWSKTLSSQMLSKQSPALAKQQLDKNLKSKQDEYDEIMALTNPVVKKQLLEAFADDCDASAVHLKAASLPRQGNHAILPFPNMNENEIYAPNYRDGEKVVLIRHPHGGTFEIPELTVNNRYKPALDVIPNAKDAVGINPKVAAQLSGADFDGDTVLVIPNNERLVKTSSPLKSLQDFDPKESYPAYDGMSRMTNKIKQQQMGQVSNLITDMTIKGASQDEIARAIRHSMVVIDAEKHSLNYKQSALDNGIADLKTIYQGGPRSGASTLVSRSSSETRPFARKENIDPETGKKVYTYTNETYVDKQGKTVLKYDTPSTRMAETPDAFSLSSGTQMETVYARYANSLKDLANTSRKSAIDTKPTPYSPSAKMAYAEEVKSLNASLAIANRNRPYERQAQIVANTVVKAKKEANPNMEAEDLKKVKGQALVEARARVGAKKEQIQISEKEWEAIQAGAVSTNTLTQILNNTDLDRVKQLATPRISTSLSSNQTARIRTMLSNGSTRAEISDALGIPIGQVNQAIKEE